MTDDDVRMPRCPRCDREPALRVDRQYFCGDESCHVVCWDATDDPETFEATATAIDMFGAEGKGNVSVVGPSRAEYGPYAASRFTAAELTAVRAAYEALTRLGNATAEADGHWHDLYDRCQQDLGALLSMLACGDDPETFEVDGKAADDGTTEFDGQRVYHNEGELS